MTLFLITLLAFLLPLAYSPGPGNLFFAALGARFGFAATLPANAGYHVATLVVTALAGAGLVSVIDPDSPLFSAVKTAGSFYVLWLAWKMAQAGKAPEDVEDRKAGFFDGVSLLILNPKAYVIILLMFSQFSGSGPAGMIEKVALITLVFTLNNLLAFALWSLAGDGLGRLFRSETGARRLNRIFAAVLAGVAVWMMLG
ncbi:putative threonine efflux protein [Hoeflea sp. IMCC20628]|uniref:LysE family translocator n=1 Tax=Hoeflea sp. IMCC20628 TaxID=1620421 RepID=UPI00063B0581|nr:LysE family translocator [Hoeflea sp. IMCC20628]AKI00418.1 putative threonine efflux protein [Hoeflea sp. IMCC20628]